MGQNRMARARQMEAEEAYGEGNWEAVVLVAGDEEGGEEAVVGVADVGRGIVEEKGVEVEREGQELMKGTVDAVDENHIVAAAVVVEQKPLQLKNHEVGDPWVQFDQSGKAPFAGSSQARRQQHKTSEKLGYFSIEK